MKLFVIGMAILIALYAGHRVLVYAEHRGWIFYRNRPRVQSLGFLEELVQPSIEYMIEEESSQRTMADLPESGQKPFRDELNAGDS